MDGDAGEPQPKRQRTEAAAEPGPARPPASEAAGPALRIVKPDGFISLGDVQDLVLHMLLDGSPAPSWVKLEKVSRQVAA